MGDEEAGIPRRRAFFRRVAARVIEPLAKHLERRVDSPAAPPRLRPPGAIEESRLVETCHRCGACVEICPADAILAVDEADGDAAGTPMIDPDRAACVVCDELRCTTVCPSGALRPIRHSHMIRMGLAEVYHPLCVRAGGEACTLCVDRCPLGEAAIRVRDEGPPEVLSSGCVGCGVCQLCCPTAPKAIVVKPFR